MTIIEKLHQLADKVGAETAIGSHATGDAFAQEAIDAILAGPLLPDKTPTLQWKHYMEHFAETQAQLDRLTLQDGQKDQPTVRKSCAYIVSNAVCGAISTTRTFDNVAAEIEP